MPWLRATGAAGGMVRGRPGGSSRHKFIILSWQHSRLGTLPQLHPLPPFRRHRPRRPQPCSIQRAHDERYEKRRVMTDVVRVMHSTEDASKLILGERGTIETGTE